MADLITGVQSALAPSALLFTLLGTVLGIVFGALPGLTSTMAIALMIPLTYGMDAVTGMGMLVGAFCGGTAGGSVSATLLAIPGTPSSICTTFDAHPMAKKGKAGLALGTSVICSFIGGVFSMVMLSILAPQLASVALQFGPLEYMTLALLGLTIIASISGKSLAKGLIGGLIGIFASCVGVDVVTGMPRLTFGNSQMLGGLSLLPVLIGLFAVSQALLEAENQVRRAADAQPEIANGGKIRAEFPKLRLLLSKWKILLSSSLLGTIIGILPGTGGSIASFVAYDTAKHLSKTTEEFGKGNIEGVIASETSNNAMTGGAMVPMMALGIPGDTATAIMMGGLLIHGLRCGPMLFVNNMPTVYGIFAALLIANCAMVVFQTFGIRLFVQILRIPRYVLTPIVIVLCTIGAFGASNNMFDVWVMLAFGVIGYFANKLGYGVAPIVLGFILGSVFEQNLRRGAEMFHTVGSWLNRPIADGLFIASMVALLLPIIQAQLAKRKANKKS